MDLTLLGALDTGMIIQYLFVLVMLVAMEGLLSADNALVLAVMVRPLSPKLRSKALFYGLIGAVVLRFTALFFRKADRSPIFPPSGKSAPERCSTKSRSQRGQRR